MCNQPLGNTTLLRRLFISEIQKKKAMTEKSHKKIQIMFSIKHLRSATGTVLFPLLLNDNTITHIHVISKNVYHTSVEICAPLSRESPTTFTYIDYLCTESCGLGFYQL